MWSASAVIVAIATALVLCRSASAQNNYNDSCKTPNNEDGNCQNIRTCEPLLMKLSDVVKNGNFLRASVCGFEGKYPRVCCPISFGGGGGGGGPRPFPSLPRPFPSLPNTNENREGGGGGGGGGGHNIQNYGPLFSPECGTTNVKLTRVVGGVPAKLGAWPWIAVLGYRSPTNRAKPLWLCGGSLISARHVLTAGHCVWNRKDLQLVRLGELELENDFEGATPIDVRIDKITIHPEYSSTEYTNDIAVLRLVEDVRFTPSIKPICLPVTNEIINKNVEGYSPFLVGWGSVYFNGPRVSKLQQIQLPVVKTSTCRAAFNSFKTATIDDRVICAGFAQGGKDACQGDSGGPLMFPIGKTFYAIGVVSYGFRCAEPGFPGVYSKVTSFLDFILPLLN